jgi:integrase
MSLYKPKGSKIWYVNIKYDNHPRIRQSSGTSNKKQAEEFETRLKQELYDKIYLKKQKDITFKELFVYYLNNGIKHLKKDTQLSYINYSELFIDFVEDKKTLDIEKEDVFNFVHYLLGKNLTVATIKRYLAGVSAVFSYGRKIGKTKINPISDFDKSFLGKENKRIRFLTKNEYEVLLANCSYELLRKAVVLAVETGLRKSELMDLKWEDNQIDFENKEITVWFTKNTEHRTIPMSPTAYDILKSLYNDKNEYETLNNKVCEYVFFNFEKEKRVKSFKKSFATAKRKANIEDFHWHDLRHTFATWALKKWFKWQKYPIDLYKLQIWLGHKDIKTTQRYAHLEIKDLHNLINFTYYSAIGII